MNKCTNQNQSQADVYQPLVVAVSTRALFDFEEENSVFETQGREAYQELQLSRLHQPAQPGVAFELIRKLVQLNEIFPEEKPAPVQVVIVSRNDPISGMRVYHSAEQWGLPLSRGVFCQGAEPFKYLKPLNASLFLSANVGDVHQALGVGVPAARVFPGSYSQVSDRHDELRIAFDGDAVLFSDQAEQIYQQQGLNAFIEHETKRAKEPLPPGPMFPFLAALDRLSQLTHELGFSIRTALITARSAPCHERALKTLMSWGVSVNEAMFLGGLDKGAFIEQYQPDFFFDDQLGHCQSAMKYSATGQVLTEVR